VHLYTAYGYALNSEIKLPGFTSAFEGKTDIIVSRRTAQPTKDKKNQYAIFAHKMPTGLMVNWHGVASYSITHGHEIVVYPEKDSIPEMVAQPLYGIVLAAILLQRSHLVLHGSSVAINGKAIVLVGEKGFGKSTLTAGLLARNHDFISDDVTAFSISNSTDLQVLSGIPRIKLWPDAVSALGYNLESLSHVSPLSPKYLLMVQDQFKSIRVPLNAIVMLDHGRTIELQEMKAADKMLWLLGGHYLAKFHHALPEKSRRLIFNQCSRFAREINIVKLVMPRDIDLLSDVIELLEQFVEKQNV